VTQQKDIVLRVAARPIALASGSIDTLSLTRSSAVHAGNDHLGDEGLNLPDDRQHNIQCQMQCDFMKWVEY